MVPLRDIRAFARRIAAEFKPRQIILFGSYAYGTPTEDSDVDLLVVMAYRGRSMDKAAEIRARIDFPHWLGLLVRSPQEVRRRLAIQDWFMHDIINRGKVLYAAADARDCVGLRGIGRSAPAAHRTRLGPVTIEWAERAERAFAIVRRLSRQRGNPNYEHCCFYSRECAEGYVKSLLQQSGRRFGRAPSFSALMTYAVESTPALSTLRADADVLGRYTLDLCYPGRSATRTMAQDALRRSARIRTVARRLLGLTSRTREQEGATRDTHRYNNGQSSLTSGRRK